MKALTILQPWAELIACGAKKIETRSWATKYRGPLAIHAGKNANTPRCAWEEPFRTVLINAGMLRPIYSKDGFAFSLRHNGCVIAIADLVDCVEINGNYESFDTFPPSYCLHLQGGKIIGEPELSFGNYTQGRYAWILENVRRIDPVPVKGMQRIWEWRHAE